MRNKLSLLTVTLLCAIAAAAQQPYRARLPAVTERGFYKILIHPEITAYAGMSGDDIRILSPDGGEVPYLKEESRALRRSDLQLFNIISSENGADGRRHIVLRHSGERPLRELIVLLRNTSAVRKIAVSGSPEGESWYPLVDSAVLKADGKGGGDTAISVLTIPGSSYPFLRLSIFNDGLLPPEIFGAGVMKGSLVAAHYIDVPTPAFLQRDSSDHRSYIRLQFDAPYRLDRLAFHFDGPRLFKRSVALYADGEAVAQFSADQTGPAGVWTELQADALVAVVDNEDSPPLRLREVTASQRRQFLLAYLEPQDGGSYELRFGDSTLSAPVYDLRHYRDSIGLLALPQLMPLGIERLMAAAVPTARQEPLLGKRSMWVIIILVLAGLIAATASLMRQMRARG